MIEIDGAMGEGGGQVLRTALTLSLCTSKAFRITRIRAKRKKPGLQRQHLTAVQAACDISGAQVEGDGLGSTVLSFFPERVWAGRYHFSIGTAGSTSLVFQTILYPLLLAEGESHLTLRGGTHNPLAPPFDFLTQAFLPLINRMGPQVTATIDRYGFFPTGGGQWTVHIVPTAHLHGLQLLERGKIVTYAAEALITGIPSHVAQRELDRVVKKLGWPRSCLHHCSLPSDQGPGNVLLLQIHSEHVTEVFISFARRGVPAERVADEVIKMAQDYLIAEVPVGEYLADQLLLPLALAGQGKFVTVTPSRHTLTNIEVIRMFLPISVKITQIKEKGWMIQVG